MRVSDFCTWNVSKVSKDSKIRVGWKDAKLKDFLRQCAGEWMLRILLVVLQHIEYNLILEYSLNTIQLDTVPYLDQPGIIRSTLK